MNTPWGNADHQKTIAPGLICVDTPSHGGYKLSPARWAVIRELFPTWKGYAPEGWLEEDCDWSLACLAFPECFDSRACHYAVLTVRGGSEGYFDEPLKWLDSPAGDAVRAKAARWTENGVEEFRLEA